MGRKVIALWLYLTMMLGMIVIVDVTMDFTMNVKGATLFVNTTGSGGAYTSIQDAINDSTDGGTVFVYNGTYYENIVVDKSINLTGENKQTTIINGSKVGHVILINSDFVNVSGFTIEYSGDKYGDSGIKLNNVQQNKIFNNNILLHLWGIHCNYSAQNTITGNNVSINLYDGIELHHSDDNYINRNIVFDNIGWGITVGSSKGGIITNNNVSNNNGNGISTLNSNGINITENTLFSNDREAIFIEDSDNIKASHNSLFSNGNCGIFLIRSFNNNISTNTAISNEWYGIRLTDSYNNTIIDNTAHSNTLSGFRLYDSFNNTYINNTSYLNEERGMEMYYSDGNNFRENRIFSNKKDGFRIYSSKWTNVTNNNISSNEGYGIYVYHQSNNNSIYHNAIINNTYQAYDDTNKENQWDNGYPSGGNYWSDYNGVDNFKGPNQDIPGSDGIGDTNYTIDADSIDRYPLMEPYKPPENYTILKQGWNLISIPLIQEEQNLSRVLGSINVYYDAVQWYDITDVNDPWKHNKVSKPFGNDLFKLNETIGFWIHITQPGNTIFLYNGNEPIQNQTIPLHTGWNMVGYPSLTSYNRTSGLNNLTFGTHVDAIWTYNAATQKYKELTELDYFEVGKGYYIHAKAECTWVVPI